MIKEGISILQTKYQITLPTTIRRGKHTFYTQIIQYSLQPRILYLGIHRYIFLIGGLITNLQGNTLHPLLLPDRLSLVSSKELKLFFFRQK